MADRTPAKWLVAAVVMLVALGGRQTAVSAVAPVRDIHFSPAQRVTTPGDADEVTLSDIIFATAPPAPTPGQPPSGFSGAILAAFISAADGNPEVYTAKFAFDTTPTPPTLSLVGPPDQITHTTAPSIQAHPTFGLFSSVVTFQSNDASLDPLISNADKSPETFFVDLIKTPPPAVEIHQLTKYPGPSGLAALGSVNPTGRISHADSSQGLVVFSSSSNSLPGTSNPSGNPQIFIYDTIDDKYYQLTNDTAAGVQNLHPVTSNLGLGIALAYVSNVTGSFNVYVQALKVDITVVPPFTNHAPSIVVTGQTTVNPNQQVTLTATADDPDLTLGDVLTLTATKGDGSLLPSGATFKTIRDCMTPTDPACKIPANVGIFSWKPTTVGPYPINFIVTDSAGVPGSQLVTITVNALPDRPPTINPSSLGTRIIKIGKPITISISGSDPDGDAVTLTMPQKPAGANLTCNQPSPSSATCTMSWTPQPGDEGSGSQNYPISATVSANGQSATAMGTITVVFNQPPVIPTGGGITTGNTTVAEFECLMLVINATDSDGDPVTVGIDPSTMPTNSVWWGGTRVLHWHPGADTPDGSFVPAGGTRQFPVTFTASDGTDTITKTITITVTDTDINANQIVTPISTSLTVSTGQALSISTMVRNSGYSTWSAPQGYALVPLTSSANVTTSAVSLAPGETVTPGSLKTFTGSVTAPTQPGFYMVRWRMSQSGTQFGPYSGYTFLNVVKPATPTTGTVPLLH